MAVQAAVCLDPDNTYFVPNPIPKNNTPNLAPNLYENTPDPRWSMVFFFTIGRILGDCVRQMQEVDGFLQSISTVRLLLDDLFRVGKSS